MTVTSPLKSLAGHGQSIWLDSLSRSLVTNGELKNLIENDGVSGVTSNPTIFQKALAEGNAYDAQLASLLVKNPTATEKDVFLALSGEDVRLACALLEPTWHKTNGKDGWASWEVDPTLAEDRAGTVAEVRALKSRVDALNLYVKIPATDQGVGAIEDAVAAGFSINVTLIFSLARHAQVIEAYVRGLERLAQTGGDVARVRSVASFFVSRVDIEADKRLAAVGRSDLAGKLAVANAKLAYQQFLTAFRGPRWDQLAKKGAHVQRCLWASTSMKDAKRRDVLYVEELIGDDTVNTMPKETLDAFRDHGVVSNTIERDLAEARRVFEEVKRAGVDYADVCAHLEKDGVKKFVDSFDALKRGIRDKRRAAAGSR